MISVRYFLSVLLLILLRELSDGITDVLRARARRAIRVQDLPICAVERLPSLTSDNACRQCRTYGIGMREFHNLDSGGSLGVNPEELLISAVLHSTSHSEALGHELTPEMFREHGAEWAWLTEYMTKHRRIPPLPSFRSAWPNFPIANVDDVAHQAEQVREDFVSTQLYESVRGVSKKLATPGQLDVVLGEIQKSVIDAAKQLGTVGDDDVLQNRKEINASLAELHDRIIDTGNAGIPTGFKSWDDTTGGCKPGESIIVGARLGVGKSWVLAKMAATAVMSGYTVLYDSLEMSRTNIALRTQTLLSQALGRPYAAVDILTSNSIPDLKAYEAMAEYLADNVPGALHVADSSRGRISPMTVAAQIERIQPDIVFIDYLTLLHMTGDGDWTSVASLSNQIQSLAQRYKIPIVSAAQLNRADGRGRDVPGSDALARSDSIGQDADQVMNVQQKSRRVRKFRLAKNRHGLSDVVWHTEFRPSAGVIDEINQERAYELIDEDEMEAG